MKISNGKIEGATQAPSPNHSGYITPRFIVMHYTATWTAESAVRTFQREGSRVSAHLTVGMDGRVYQHVPFNVKAWHAGPSEYMGYSGLNNHSIGIEIVNPGYLRKSNTAFKDHAGRSYTSAEVGEYIAEPYPKVGSGTFYWPCYTASQISTLESLTKAIVDEYSILDVVSHEEIDTRGWKTDPGPAFPLHRYKKFLDDRDHDVIDYKVTASVLNQRGGPGTTFKVVGKLREGQLVHAIGQKGDWVKLNRDAWVHGAYLRRI